MILATILKDGSSTILKDADRNDEIADPSRIPTYRGLFRELVNRNSEVTPNFGSCVTAEPPICSGISVPR